MWYLAEVAHLKKIAEFSPAARPFRLGEFSARGEGREERAAHG